MCIDNHHPCTERCRLPDGTCAITRANGGPMTLREISAVLGVTHQAVQFIERRALRKVRQSLSWEWRHD